MPLLSVFFIFFLFSPWMVLASSEEATENQLWFWQHDETRETKVTVQFFIKGLDPAGQHPESKGEPETIQPSQRL